jgi:hypothetical protein
MRARWLMALVVLGAFTGAGCRGAADEAVETQQTNAESAGEQPAESAAVTEAAPSTEASAEQATERPQPEAPRAEGDRLAELLASEDYLLLDVRRADELEELGTVEGYLNIPIEELADRLDEVPRDRAILTA